MFSKRLKELLEEKEMKPAELARLAGINRSNISKYLTIDDRDPYFSHMIRIAQALDVNVEYLYGSTDIRESYYKNDLNIILSKLSEKGRTQVYEYAKLVLNSEKV